MSDLNSGELLRLRATEKAPQAVDKRLEVVDMCVYNLVDMMRKLGELPPDWADPYEAVTAPKADMPVIDSNDARNAVDTVVKDGQQLMREFRMPDDVNGIQGNVQKAA